MPSSMLPSVSPPFDLDGLAPDVDRLAARLRALGARLVTAESCTGGLIAAACTAVSGSSDWFEAGFVTYSNAAKTRELGVPAELIATQGAVSEPVARAMALGAVEALAGQQPVWSVAVTGIAGPTGGTVGKPVGLVWMAIARPSQDPGRASKATVITFRDVFPGSRAEVRSATVRAALSRLHRELSALR